VDRLTDPSSRMGIQPVKVNGEYVFNDKEILHEMEEVHVKKHYVPKNVDKTVEEQVKSWVSEAKVETEYERSTDCEINPADICNADITAEEVKRTFHQCSNTPGPDGITGSMIDNADRQMMSECLLRIWNKVWSTGEVPSQWKLEHRNLIPKHGKESYNECGAYRTVSITDILGKRLEKVISDRIKCKFWSQGFDENQFAYLKRRSSIQAVLLLAEVIKTNVFSENCIGVVFFDFTDAFGSVNRTKLVYKLRDHFGISGRLLLYLVSFLSGRQARITVNDLI